VGKIEILNKIIDASTLDAQFTDDDVADNLLESLEYIDNYLEFYQCMYSVLDLIERSIQCSFLSKNQRLDKKNSFSHISDDLNSYIINPNTLESGELNKLITVVEESAVYNTDNFGKFIIITKDEIGE